MSKNSNLHVPSMVRSTLLLLALGALLCGFPASGQEVDGIEHDPGFPHNHVGRTIGGVNSGYRNDPGTYCGPLPRYACGGGRFSQLLYSGHDPFHPLNWAQHDGNDWARNYAAKKGLPLQTLVVRHADGSPAADVPVRFYQAGYNKKGIIGRTDDAGEFVVAVKKTDKNHRFLVEAEGFRRARLDVLGRELRTASHDLVLEPSDRRPESKWESSNAPHRIAVIGSDAVPRNLARDYKKALEALERGAFDIATVEFKTLVERWPVGTLEEGGTYEPRRLLIEALEASGQALIAEKLEQRPLVVTTDATKVSG